MKNKRIASIVLAMTLVLSTFSTVFATDFDIIEVDGTGRYGFTKWTIDSKLFPKITISPQKYFIEYGEENYELDKVMEKMNDGKSFEDAIAELEPVEEEDEGELKVVSVSAINETKKVEVTVNPGEDFEEGIVAIFALDEEGERQAVFASENITAEDINEEGKIVVEFDFVTVVKGDYVAVLTVGEEEVSEYEFDVDFEAVDEAVAKVNDAAGILALDKALSNDLFDDYRPELIEKYNTEKPEEAFKTVAEVNEFIKDINEEEDAKEDKEAFQEELVAEYKKGKLSFTNYLAAEYDVEADDAHVDGYIEELIDTTTDPVTANVDSHEEAQARINYVNAELAVEALFKVKYTELAEGVGEDEIATAKALVEALPDQEDSEEPTAEKAALQASITKAEELLAKPLTDALEVINGKEAYTVEEKEGNFHPGTYTFNHSDDKVERRKISHAMTVFMMENAELLDIDVEGDFAELRYASDSSRRTAVARDLIFNRQFEEDEKYTLERFQKFFGEIVSTRYAAEQSVALYKEQVEAGELEDLTYLDIMLDQFKSVSYKMHSETDIKEAKIPEIENAIEDYNALSGKKVMVNEGGDLVTTGGTEMDAQEYVRTNLPLNVSSSGSITEFAQKVKEVEQNIAALAKPEGFEVVETENIKITAGEEVEFTIHAYKDEVDGEKLPLEKFNRIYKDVKVWLSGEEFDENEDTFFYRDIEFVNGVAKVSVPVTDTDVTKLTIEADVFEVTADGTELAPKHQALVVDVEVEAAELDEVKYEITGDNDTEITFTAVDKFKNEIKMFKGNVRVQLPAGVKSTDPKSDATGLVMYNAGEEGTATFKITLKDALTAGTYTFTVGGEEVVIVIEAETDEVA